MGEVAGLPRVAAIATMASRLHTFERMLAGIHRQVDRVFVYLDGHPEPPAFLQGLERVSVFGAEATAALHASARFLCLRELTTPSVVAVVDDDILYPDDYLDRLAALLDELGGDAVCGVHGRIFLPPHQSYFRDATTAHFARAVSRPSHVHEVGAGTSAFVSDRLPIDPHQWDRHDMDDIMLATEAQMRGLPRFVVARPAGWLRPQAQAQADSLWESARKDESEQSRRMRALLGLY